MRISPCLVFVFVFIQTGLTQTDKYTDENRPYKFGFNIEGYQHRKEEKNEKGIIKGEYGFITADGYYRVTVYATDENGDFRIISMKNYYVGFPPEDPQVTPIPGPQYGPGRQPSGPSVNSVNPSSVSVGGQRKEEAERNEKKPIQLTGLSGCSDCVIPTTKKPGVGNRFGGGGSGGTTPFGGQAQRGGGQAFGGGSGGNTPNLGTRGGNQGGIGEPQRGFGGQGGSGGLGGQRGGISGGVQGGRGTQTGGLPGSGTGRPTPGSGPVSGGQYQNPSPNRGTTGGDGEQRPQLGVVRDGLPKGVTVDDIKALLYTFNYTVGFHGHHEDGYRNGDKEGDYFFDGRDGVERKVEYIANEFGYQPNITFVDLAENDVRRPKEETEKNYGLKGYEFKWFYRK